MRDAGAVVDLAVVGSGPAGACAALAARRDQPGLTVALVDASTFPRDKACGDGVAPHVLDLLAEVGLASVLDDRVPVHTLRLVRGRTAVARRMRRPAVVVPRTVLDDRLHRAAVAAGATPVRGRVRSVRATPEGPVALDLGHGRSLLADLVVGADGANSVVRRALPGRPGPVAVAVRGYAPVRADRQGEQVISFGTSRQPAYAWSFDRGDGLANVGYGEVLDDRRPRLNRAGLVRSLEALLPGATVQGRDWRGHHLPLSSARPLRPAAGRVLLAGDAAGLVNPLSGEGIHAAVATGLLAGRTAAAALVRARPDRAAGVYTRATRRLLAGHRRHVALAATLTRHDVLLDAGLRAAAASRSAFDDLVELGLARGRLTVPIVARLTGELIGDLADQLRGAPDRGAASSSSGRRRGEE